MSTVSVSIGEALLSNKQSLMAYIYIYIFVSLTFYLFVSLSINLTSFY